MPPQWLLPARGVAGAAAAASALAAGTAWRAALKSSGSRRSRGCAGNQSERNPLLDLVFAVELEGAALELAQRHIVLPQLHRVADVLQVCVVRPVQLHVEAPRAARPAAQKEGFTCASWSREAGEDSRIWDLAIVLCLQSFCGMQQRGACMQNRPLGTNALTLDQSLSQPVACQQCCAAGT